MTWYYRRYRPNAFRKGQQGTCRQCNDLIHFHEDPASRASWEGSNTRGIWLHEGQTPEESLDADHTAHPKEFCSEVVTVEGYDLCGSPVKYEDVQAGNYACGRHMRKWMEELEYHKARELKRERDKEREEILRFERAQYTEAGRWVKEHFPQLIEKDWKADRYMGVNRTTDVDVFLLKEFLVAIVEKLASLGISEVAANMDAVVVDE
jgi:hypothetical protein